MDDRNNDEIHDRSYPVAFQSSRLRLEGISHNPVQVHVEQEVSKEPHKKPNGPAVEPELYDKILNPLNIFLVVFICFNVTPEHTYLHPGGRLVNPVSYSLAGVAQVEECNKQELVRAERVRMVLGDPWVEEHEEAYGHAQE
jgi:hypothetical protein